MSSEESQQQLEQLIKQLGELSKQVEELRGNENALSEVLQRVDDLERAKKESELTCSDLLERIAELEAEIQRLKSKQEIAPAKKSIPVPAMYEECTVSHPEGGHIHLAASGVTTWWGKTYEVVNGKPKKKFYIIFQEDHPDVLASFLH